MRKFRLERYRFFPIVAWTLIIAFVLFTYSLTIELVESTSDLSSRTEQNLSALEGTFNSEEEVTESE